MHPLSIFLIWKNNLYHKSTWAASERQEQTDIGVSQSKIKEVISDHFMKLFSNEDVQENAMEYYTAELSQLRAEHKVNIETRLMLVELEQSLISLATGWPC